MLCSRLTCPRIAGAEAGDTACCLARGLEDPEVTRPGTKQARGGTELCYSALLDT